MIHLIYRSYGGENVKSRPAYYSKTLALASFIRAAQRADCPIVFLNDGPIPEPRLAMMQASGEVVQIAETSVGMRDSYRAAWGLPKQRGWTAETLIYFSEDDYLYHPDAFVVLGRADAELSEATYFALYGSTNKFHNATEFRDGNVYPEGFARRPDRLVGDSRWVNIPSTASTFGARAGALRTDEGIMRQCMYPFRTRFLDHETCLLYQGHVPFRGAQVVIGPPGCYPWTVSGMAKRFGLTPFRIGLNARAMSRRRRPHALYVAEPNLACHMELPVMTPGQDWEAVAADTREWLSSNALGQIDALSDGTV